MSSESKVNESTSNVAVSIMEFLNETLQRTLLWLKEKKNLELAIKVCTVNNAATQQEQSLCCSWLAVSQSMFTCRIMVYWHVFCQSFCPASSFDQNSGRPNPLLISSGNMGPSARCCDNVEYLSVLKIKSEKQYYGIFSAKLTAWYKNSMLVWNLFWTHKPC